MTMGKRKLDRRDMSDLDHIARESFWREARGQRCCRMCEDPKKKWQAHHIVYEQHLRDVGAPIWDNRNSMRLCDDCHRRHHNRSQVVPLSKLSNRNVEYAFEALGLRAYDYLGQKYEVGEDQRLEQELARREQEQHGDGTGSP